MVSNYFLFLVGVGAILIGIFKIKNEVSFRLFGILSGIEGILISLAGLTQFKQVLNYPIAAIGVIIFIILTYKAWKIRKIPGKRVGAYYWLIGMPTIAIFALIMYLLIESGVFGE